MHNGHWYGAVTLPLKYKCMNKLMNIVVVVVVIRKIVKIITTVIITQHKVTHTHYK